MKTIVLADLGTHLASRTGARLLREELELLTGEIVIDLAGVQTLSESFADELFAVLLQERGEDWFRTNVSLRNVSVSVRNTILCSIDARLNKSASRNPLPPPPDDLETAAL